MERNGRAAVMESPTEYLRIREAADFLRVSRSLIRFWIRTGKLRGRRPRGSRVVLVARRDLEALLES